MRPKPIDEALARVVRAEMRRTQTPRIAVGVLRGSRAQASGFGIASVEAAPGRRAHALPDRINDQDVTAAAVMRLVEKRTIDLDAPMRRYLPGFRMRDERVGRRGTLRHCFTHTGGWLGDFFDDTGRGNDALEKVVAALRRTPQLTPLGETWSYNNAGFYVAGRVLERVARKPYKDVIRETLFEPLAMSESFFFAEDVISRPCVVGHVVRRRGPAVAPPWALARSVNPAGGIVASVVDQLRWARFNLGDGRAPGGKRILRASTMRTMQQPHAPAGCMADHVGIAWLLRDVDGERLVEHGGTTEGQSPSFALVPARAFAITVLTNSNRGREACNEIHRWALRRYLGLAAGPPTMLSPPRDGLAALGGTYPKVSATWPLRVDWAPRYAVQENLAPSWNT